MAQEAPPQAHVPSSGTAKLAVYTRCSANGCTLPVIGSDTKDAWWCEWYRLYSGCQCNARCTQ